jgi:hypothetical protein
MIIINAAKDTEAGVMPEEKLFAEMEWTRRFPNPAGDVNEAEIEVRQLFELEDFTPSESIERYREIGVGSKR